MKVPITSVKNYHEEHRLELTTYLGDDDGIAGKVTATWHGGAYIDLAFAHHAQAIEVINVWDDEHDEATIPFSGDALTDTVLDWIHEQQRHDADWYENYLRNGYG